MSAESGDLRNLPPGRDGTHFPVTVISSPIRDGSAKNGANGSTGWVNNASTGRETECTSHNASA
jgi:hypothetical protein